MNFYTLKHHSISYPALLLGLFFYSCLSNAQIIEIKGIVTDEKGMPIENAKVTIVDRDINSYTDKKGHFELADIENIEEISISHINYITETRNHDLSSRMRVQLKEELIHIIGPMIIGYKKQKETFNGAIKVHLPEGSSQKDIKAEYPGGFSELNRFLGWQIRYPALAQQNEISGKTKVTFTINNLGRVENVQIKEGLGFGIDEQLIEAINSMPKWKPALQKGQPSASRIEMEFGFFLTE